MQQVKPVYIKLLIVAIAIFVVGVGLALSDLYAKVGQLEHDMMHGGPGKCPMKHTH